MQQVTAAVAVTISYIRIDSNSALAVGFVRGRVKLKASLLLDSKTLSVRTEADERTGK